MKYKLQRNPYENENKSNKLDDNQDQIVYKADEQLLKEDLNLKFRQKIWEINDVEFIHDTSQIYSHSLLYSPFELYTNFRMRNQIILLNDMINALKINFNKEFIVFMTDKNQTLEKINSKKIEYETAPVT